MRFRITLNVHCSFLTGLLAFIFLELGVLCLAASIVDDWRLLCESSSCFRKTKAVSGRSLAHIALVDLNSTAFLSRNRGHWRVVPSGEWLASPEGKRCRQTPTRRTFLSFTCNECLLVVANEGNALALSKSASSSTSHSRNSRIHRRDERERRLDMTAQLLTDG